MIAKVAYQGEPGAYSHLTARDLFPDAEATACETFDAAFEAVEQGVADRAVIPIENSLAGRVADIHGLLPHARLHIVAEHFAPVRHQLLVRPGVALNDVDTVRSHVMALAQCRRLTSVRGWRAERDVDTAGAARWLAERDEPRVAVIASALAAEIYGLEILLRDVADDPTNTTRFIVLSAAPERPEGEGEAAVTSLMFRVRNVPAALFKAMGGFATNGVNMTKLESYQPDGDFNASQFYAEVDGRPEDPPLARALEELQFFSTRTRILGVYAAHPFRKRP